MILDNLKNAEDYFFMHPKFEEAFKFLQENDLSALEPGKHIIDGKNLFANMDARDGKMKDKAFLETHKNYIDIQYCVSGKDTIGYLATNECKNERDPYNPEKDVLFFTDTPKTYVDILPGYFAIFFPKDGHSPSISDGKIKKIILKILI